MKAPSIIPFLLFFLMNVSFAQDTLILQPGPEDGQDARVFTLDPVPHPDLTIGYVNSWTYQGEPGTARTYFRFDLSFLNTGTEIIHAWLSLYGNDDPVYAVDEHNTYGESNASFIRKAAGDWEESTINWSNQPGYLTEFQVPLKPSEYGSEDYEGIEFTRFIKDIVEFGEPNYGFVHMLETEEHYRSMAFLSSDHPDAASRPKLTIVIGCDMAEVSFSYQSDYKLISFDGQVNSPSVISLSWDFGDGSGSYNEDPVHYFAKEGTYQVCFTVEDSCTTVSFCDSIKICKAPEAGFSWLADGHMVSFQDTTFEAIEWYWDFGDGDFAVIQNPQHYYLDFGEYDVCLSAHNGCIWDSICRSVIVSAPGILETALGSLTIYPIPVSEILFIQSEIPVQFGYSILSTEGRMVKEGKMDLSGVSNGQIRLAEVPPGIFILRLSSGNITGNIKLVVI